MKIILKLVLMGCGLISLAFGQHVGDSEQAVRQAWGNPMAVRKSPERDTWLYSEGRRVVFEKGVVASASGFPENAPTVVAEKNTPVTRVETAPKGTVSEVHVVPVIKKTQPPSSKFPPQDSAGKDKRGVIVAGIGIVIIAICGIVLLIEAFRASVWWGLAVLFFPIAQIIFVFTHWTESKKPFLITLLVGYPLLVTGLVLGIDH